MIENTLVLPDGRTLGFAEYGSPSGKPILYFHTHPGSRINGRFLEALAQKNDIRIIAPERPGSGLSDYQENRTLLDWPKDIVALTDSLEIDSFSVLGASGGGPYAAVCAHQIPDRADKAALLSSVGPMMDKKLTAGMQSSNKLIFGIAKLFPKLVPYMMTNTEQGVKEKPEAVIQQLKKTMTPVDVQAMDSGNHWQWFIDDLKEAFRNGAQGPSRDVILYAQDWGFDLQEIKIPVSIWQGEKDTNAPASMGRYLADQIPGSTLNLYPLLGHLSLILTKAEEALIWLKGE